MSTSTPTRSRCLRTAYELYKRDDLLSDLVAHFRRQADAASPARPRRIYPRLALSSILWWSDDEGRGDRRADQGRRGVAGRSPTSGSTWPS